MNPATTARAAGGMCAGAAGAAKSITVRAHVGDAGDFGKQEV